MEGTFNINKNTSISQKDEILKQSNANTLSNKKDNSSPKKADFSFLFDYILWENKKEDERLISEYFKLIKIEEIISSLIIIITISCCFIYHETRICTQKCSFDEKNRDNIITLSLVFCSVSAFGFIIILGIKYYHYFHLYKNARYIQPYTNFFGTSLYKFCLIEFILAILHPNILFKNKYYTTSKQYNLKIITYNVNDLFSLLQWIRLIYLIINASIFTNFYSSRADRICKMMSKQLDLFFAFRSLFIRHTASFLIFAFLIICSALAYMLKVASEPIKDSPEQALFTNFGNCFWYVLVTMTTVGYGDMYPKTTIQRIICCFIAFFGIVVIALIVTFFQDRINLTDQEKNSLDFQKRIYEKDKVMRISAEYFKDNMLYIINKKKIEKGIVNFDKANKNKLIRLLKKRIDSKKIYNNLYHNFHVNFNMGNEVDEIKRKIDNLDFVGSDLTSNISLLDNKIKDLIVLMNKSKKVEINKNLKKNKSEDNINSSSSISGKNDDESIKEIEPEPKDSE